MDTNTQQSKVEHMKYALEKERKPLKVLQWTHLNPDAVINTEPEEQQGTQEQSLKESI